MSREGGIARAIHSLTVFFPSGESEMLRYWSFRGASIASEPQMRLADRGISRFRVWSLGPSRNDPSHLHLRLLRGHPFKLRQLVPEPGELPLGVMAGVGAANVRGLIEGDLATQMPDQRRHTMGFHCRQ